MVRKKTYKELVQSVGVWEKVIHKYKADSNAVLGELADRVRSGNIPWMDERDEIFRIHLLKREILQRRDIAARILITIGFTVNASNDGGVDSVSWDQTDPRFDDIRFRAMAYERVREHQQTFEEMTLLSLAVRMAEEKGISRRHALLAMPGVIVDFTLNIAPVFEYNLLRLLQLDEEAIAKIAGQTSASINIFQSARLTQALKKKRIEEVGEGKLREVLREEILSAVANLPHIGDQLDTSPAGITQFTGFRSTVLRNLVTPPGASNKEVLTEDFDRTPREAEGGASAVETGDPLEIILTKEAAHDYSARYSRFYSALSPQEKTMVETIRQLEEEKDGGRITDKEIAECMSISPSQIPNLRQRMRKKFEKAG